MPHPPSAGLIVVDSDVLRLQCATTDGVRQRGCAAVIVVWESTPYGQVQQDEVRVVDSLSPGVGGQVRLHDLPEENAVDEPTDSLELLGAIDLEGVGVEVALAGAPRTLTRAHEAVCLAAWPAWVHTAVHYPPDPIDSVDVFHDVELSNGWPVPERRLIAQLVTSCLRRTHW